MWLADLKAMMYQYCQLLKEITYGNLFLEIEIL